MWFILEIRKWQLRGSFQFFADEVADQSFKIVDKVDPLLIFDWYYFTMKLEMAVGAARRRRWASFEGDLAVLKLNGRLIFWALVGHLLGRFLLINSPVCDRSC